MTAADNYGGSWLDLAYIRARVPVTEVARELGIVVLGKSGRCWRAENHQNADRSPSLSFTKRNRWKCHVCDGRARSSLDLVMEFLRCDLRGAVEWIAARFDVPQVERGKHAIRRGPFHPHGIRALGISPLEELVRDGFWAHLSGAARNVLATLCAFRNPDEPRLKVRISLRAIRRYGGISLASASRGVNELKAAGLVAIGPGAKRGIASDCNTYELTFESPSFLEKRRSVSQKLRIEVEFEREAQKAAREARKAFGCTLGKPVPHAENAAQAHDLIGDTRGLFPRPFGCAHCGLRFNNKPALAYHQHAMGHHARSTPKADECQNGDGQKRE